MPLPGSGYEHVSTSDRGDPPVKGRQRLGCMVWGNLEGVQLLFWLLKDAFWCCMFAPGSFAFGVPAASLQWLFLYLDWRHVSSRFHNFALAMWLTGNFFWMVGETTFMPAADHGKNLPVNLSNVPVFGDGDKRVFELLRNTATTMFCIALFALLLFYLFFRGAYRAELEEELAQATDPDRPNPSRRSLMETSVAPFGMASRERGLVAYDNIHIIFWVCKDLFWSIKDSEQLLPRYVIADMAAVSSVLTMVVGSHVAYLAHKHTMMRAYRDGVTLVFWVTGNALWMIGELWFYDGLRLYALASFVIGLFTHVYAMQRFEADMALQAAAHLN